MKGRKNIILISKILNDVYYLVKKNCYSKLKLKKESFSFNEAKIDKVLDAISANSLLIKKLKLNTKYIILILITKEALYYNR